MGLDGPQLIGLVIQCCISGLLGAVLLKIAVRWVEGTPVAYGEAYVITVFSSIVSRVVGVVVASIVAGAMQSREAKGVAGLVMLPVGIAIMSTIVSSRLELPFIRGVYISLATAGVGILIAISVLAIIFGYAFLH